MVKTYWHFCSEIEGFQRASSLQGPRPLAIMLEHMRGGVAPAESVLVCTHCMLKDDGQHYFTVGLRQSSCMV